MLSTITSEAFTNLTISVIITPPKSHAGSQHQARWWHPVDNALDRFSLCRDVTLVASPSHRWVVEGGFKELVEKSFPSMWENGRVVIHHDPYLASQMKHEVF